ncbi:MAG: TlpA disulfide reductase family protein [Bacteroidota bacterium]
MMKKLRYLIFVIFWSCQGDAPDTFLIEGSIDGLNSRDLIYAKIKNGKPVYLDTINVSSNQFVYKASELKQEDFRFLVPIYDQKKFIKIFLDNSDIYLNGNIDSLKDVKIIGSESHDLFARLMSDYALIEKESQVINLEYQLAVLDNDSVGYIKLEEDLFANESRKSSLFLDFANKHPDSDLSAWALYQITAYDDYNTLKSSYDKLSEKVKLSLFSKNLELVLNEMAKTAIGAQAPGFILPDINGENVTLEDFKGKFVLLNFWSPMCSYCRRENPKVAELYNSYREFEFEILGINMEDEFDQEIWELVVKEDKLLFTQLLDTIGTADIFKVPNTPYNILLDKDGRIIAKDLHDERLELKLKEIFLKK